MYTIGVTAPHPSPPKSRTSVVLHDAEFSDLLAYAVFCASGKAVPREGHRSMRSPDVLIYAALGVNESIKKSRHFQDGGASPEKALMRIATKPHICKMEGAPQRMPISHKVSSHCNKSIHCQDGGAAPEKAQPRRPRSRKEGA